MAGFPWQCPFCGHHATITGENYSSNKNSFDDGNKYGRRTVIWHATTCPNPKCKESAFRVGIYKTVDQAGGSYRIEQTQHTWQLLPAANMKILPDYVPAPIVADYKEACLIETLSPKASATLSRRALQGMIRDFWGISKPTLFQEIEAIKDKVDELAWNAITGVRKIGNVGAHMEADINAIVDVEPEEARLLIELVETLVDDWYVARHQKQSRMTRLVDAVKTKFAPKAEPQAE